MIRHGIFLERPNRFVAKVRLEDGSERLVHVASSGRMVELLVPGAPVIVTGEGKPGQKTAGLLAMVRQGNAWVSVDTAMPGKVLKTALLARQVEPFAAYTTVRPEFTYGQSRIDFLLTGEGQLPCLLEVKSVTLLVTDPDGARVGRFPDAPTARGTKHLHELAAARSEGYRTAVCFLVQRDDAEAFGPHDAVDPTFGAALRAVAQLGVEVYAWSMQILPNKIALEKMLPLRF
ncbi:MAG: DNA/RNA nuclease SfsA [Mycobacterium leprae]